MTDIVMMLRDQHCLNEYTVRCMCLDAASEIVRLRSALKLISEHPVFMSQQYEVGCREMMRLADMTLRNEYKGNPYE